MRRTLSLLLSGMITIGLLAACGMKEDWTNPKYVGKQIEAGNEKGLREFQRLDDEGRAACVPSLIRAYNNNLMQREVVRALVSAPDERAGDVFRSALARPDDAIAALGARGLAAINDTSSSQAIAERLGAVTTPTEFAPFLDALAVVPTDEALTVVSRTLLRPASRIGGIQTIRKGCGLLGRAQTPNDEIIEALVFSMVNFVPQPYQDAINECELAILAHADTALPKLVETYNGQNARTNDHLRSLDYPVVVARLRAALALSHIDSDAASEAIRGFFNTPQEVPFGDLASMNVQQQQNWYSNRGQLFQVSARGLGYRNTEANIAMLRSLENTGEEMALNNFTDWFQLSEGAEVGLRQSVHEALMIGGHEQDRELLWQRAESGEVARGGSRSDVMLRINTLHYVGRTARVGEIPRYEQVVAAQPERWRGEFESLRAYFVLAEQCTDDVACYGQRIADPSPVLEDERIATMLAGIENEQAQTMTRNGVTAAINAGAIWTLATRLKANPAAGTTLLGHIGHGDMQTRLAVGEALLTFDELPAGATEAINTQLEADADRRGVPGLRESRHLLKVLLVR